MKYGQQRQRRYGSGATVGEASRAGLPWQLVDDQLIGQYDVLDDAAVSRLVQRLGRLPSEIRLRHPIVHHQQEQAKALATRRLLIEQIARKRSIISPA